MIIVVSENMSKYSILLNSTILCSQGSLLDCLCPDLQAVRDNRLHPQGRAADEAGGLPQTTDGRERPGEINAIR